MLKVEAYEGREQAYVKHFVLEHYLQRLAYKLGNFRPGVTINYVDGFSGPWNQLTDDLSDTSPHIALARLSEAKSNLDGKGVTVRCLFIEKNKDSFARLQNLVRRFPGVEARTLHGEFEQLIGEVCEFAQYGKEPFSFVFIDPTGWTGYGLKAISRVLAIHPGEVLINFMTNHIRRFIDDEDSTARETFVDLFGDDKYRVHWRGLEGHDREDAIVDTYCARVRKAGGYSHCVSTVVLDPNRDRTHYHLVYATRSVKGLQAFREVERSAMREQGALRDELAQKARVGKKKQAELFTPTVMSSGYADELRERYHEKARERVGKMLDESSSVPYDRLVETALSFPMTSEHDLKNWLKTEKNAGAIEYVGLAPREKVPKLGASHRIRRVSG